MTTKTSNGSASGLLSSASITTKVKPMASSIPKQLPVSLYPSNKLTAELRANIDKKWEACWPLNSLRPLVLLDTISYLLFIKKLDDRQLIAGLPSEIFVNLLHKKENEELSWRSLKSMDMQSMHKLFTKEGGIADLVKAYGTTNLPYSLFVKEPLLLTPTPIVLTNLVDIIKMMEAGDNYTAAAIFEYLLNKSEIVAQNGQVYAPDYIVKLMVAMMQPAPEDVIGDPSAGNGTFLVNSAMYIAQKNSAAIPGYKYEPGGDIYKGIESDLIQLRIGAMNMILHGLEDPKLQGLNVFSKANLTLREQPSLIFSNLFFEGTDEKVAAKANNLQTEVVRPEANFLNLILKSLKSGGRAAVIVREIILYDNLTDVKSIRRQIVEDNKLEAVISLPAGTGSLFYGASLLIFTKAGATTTEKVWFYKMDARKEGINEKTDALSFMEECDDIQDILMRWKNDKEETLRKRTDKSFYVSINDIRANNYNLSFNEYRRGTKGTELYTTIETAPATKEVNPVKPAQAPVKPMYEKIKFPAPASTPGRRRPNLFVSVLTICIVLLALYFIFSKSKNTIPPAAKNISAAAEIKPAPTTHKPAKSAPGKEMLTSEQIKAILKDTTGIIHFQSQPGSVSPRKVSAKVLTKNNNTNTPVSKISAPVPYNLRVRYTVADTTFFHDEPDDRTRRKSYLDPLNKNVLTPIDDKNGFIFIVYTNHSGRTSKGWIKKRDLKLLKK